MSPSEKNARRSLSGGRFEQHNGWSAELFLQSADYGQLVRVCVDFKKKALFIRDGVLKAFEIPIKR